MIELNQQQSVLSYIVHERDRKRGRSLIISLQDSFLFAIYIYTYIVNELIIQHFFTKEYPLCKNKLIQGIHINNNNINQKKQRQYIHIYKTIILNIKYVI